MGRVAGSLLLLAVLAHGQDLVRVSDDTHRISIAVPAAWRMTPIDKEGAVLQLRGESADSGPVTVAVFVLQGPRCALSQAYSERDVRAREENTRSVEVEAGPPPRLLWRFQRDDRTYIDAFSYFIVRRNLVTVRVTCLSDEWPRLRDASITIATSLEAAPDEWPPAPPGYARTERDGIVWLVHPGVAGSDVKELVAFVRDVARRFEKVHGKVAIDVNGPPMIVVCRNMDEMKQMGSESPAYGAAHDRRGGRIFLTPLGGDGRGERGQITATTWMLLHSIRYGGCFPHWVWEAECNLAYSEEMCGKRAPLVTKWVRERLPDEPVPLSQVMAKRYESQEAAELDSGLAYVLLFRAGPARYRKAWRAFLDDYASTRDLAGSLERNLSGIDDDALREDLARWVARSVRVAEGK